jgi:HD superfamily phosphohydrolase
MSQNNYIKIKVRRDSMIYNPIDIVKGILDERDIDIDSFDKAELDCYRRNYLLRDFVFAGSRYDIIDAILAYTNYSLIYSNGKLSLRRVYETSSNKY